MWVHSSSVDRGDASDYFGGSVPVENVSWAFCISSNISAHLHSTIIGLVV